MEALLNCVAFLYKSTVCKCMRRLRNKNIKCYEKTIQAFSFILFILSFILLLSGVSFSN